MLPWTATAIFAGQLFAAGFAAGLNLYATLALIGLAARLELIAPLPPGVRGLSNSLVIGSAAVLLILELVVEKLPIVGALWAGVHTIVRPTAAALLTWLAVDMLPLEQRVAAAVGIGLLAFAAHGAKTGLRVAFTSARRPRGAWLAAAAALAMDALAAAVAIAALFRPAAALTTAAAALAALLLFGPRLWRASTFGARALLARIVGFFGRRGWKPRERLPLRIRAAVPAAPLGTAVPRGTRAAALGLRGAGAYRNGWIVVGGGPTRFVFRTLTGARALPLPRIDDAEIRPGTISDAIRARSERRSFTLFLLKDGPAPAITLAEILEHR